MTVPLVVRRPACSICGTVIRVLHFGLLRGITRPDGRPTTRGAGSINLCEKCWRHATTRAATRKRTVRRLPAAS